MKNFLWRCSLSEEDPTFRVNTNEETGQTIIAGMGELHLEILRDRMIREFHVEANVGKPEVAYKETITIPGKLRRSTSSSLVVAVSTLTYVLRLSQMKKVKATKLSVRLSVVLFLENTSPHSSRVLKKDWQLAFSQAISLVDVKVAIIFGSYHEVDSNEMAFKICGSMALKEAARKCQPILLEPIMKVVVTTPEQFMGDVIGDY